MLEKNQSRNVIFDRFMLLLYLIAFAVLIGLLVKGSSFYFSSAAERFRMPDFRPWRPAGFIGHGLGILGSTMMILMLLYSLRKRTKIFRDMGHLNYWLKIHIFFGILGPLFIVLHTSFQLRGLVVVSFWSMIAVAASGVLGRYLYLQLPRNIFGEELNLQQATELNARSFKELSQLGLFPNQLDELQKMVIPAVRDGWGSLRILLAIFSHDMMFPFRQKKIHRFIDRQILIDKSNRKSVWSLIQQQALLQRRIILWNSLHSLFNYWHVIHKPFAYIMYLILAVHVSVAIWLGYSWIF